MSRHLRIGLVFLAVAAAAMLAYGLTSRLMRDTVAEDAAQQQVDDDATLREATRLRVDTLMEDGCQSRVSDLVALNGKDPIRSPDAIPEQLRSDLVLCLERGLLPAYLKGELEDTGLIKLLQPEKGDPK